VTNAPGYKALREVETRVNECFEKHDVFMIVGLWTLRSIEGERPGCRAAENADGGSFFMDSLDKGG